MKTISNTMRMRSTLTATALLVGALLAPMLAGCSREEPATTEEDSSAAVAPETDLDAQVAEYLRLFPYQETYRYAILQTGGDPARLNVWVMASRNLLKAGEDAVVRSNNDTLYKMAWLYLGEGPVVLGSAAPSDQRFTSFQLQDDRNANYRNIIQPAGRYTLYHGEEPENITGEAVEVPSLLSAVIVRIEVKDAKDAADMADALSVFDGVTIEGPVIEQMPVVDVLSGFDGQVAEDALRQMDQAKRTVPYRDMIVAPGQEPGRDVTYLNHATGTKEGWGGPATSHSAYESMYNDDAGETLDGSRGEYVLVTEEPPVNAFWSVTVYDSETGRFHPNEHDRYHINDTTAVKDHGGTVTFHFKVSCGETDQNCLEVPAGPFDVAARYYLPEPEIRSGAWTMVRPSRVGAD